MMIKEQSTMMYKTPSA